MNINELASRISQAVGSPISPSLFQRGDRAGSYWQKGGSNLAQQITQALKQFKENIRAELDNLREIPRAQRTPEQTGRIAELKSQLADLRRITGR